VTSPVRRAYRRLVKKGSRLDRQIRQRRPSRNEERVFEGFRIIENSRSLVVDPDEGSAPPIGIYLYGGCDLPSLFGLGLLAAPTARGGIAISDGRGRLAMSRADLLLQTLEELPAEAVDETVRRMGLPRDDFSESELFSPTFTTDVKKYPEVPKSVVVLSGGANVIRPVYRHKQAGFLVDPGIKFLGADARMSSEDLAWFKSTFEPAGRMKVEDLADLMTRLVKAIKSRTGAEVLVLNTLTVEPGSRDHNYQLRRFPEGQRRLEFLIAMAELAPMAGFHVVDVDAVLKRVGIKEQLDFAHFPASAAGPVAEEAYRVLTDIGVL
jgi:hypothetical protein